MSGSVRVLKTPDFPDGFGFPDDFNFVEYYGSPYPVVKPRPPQQLVSFAEFLAKIIEAILFALLDLPIKERRYARRIKKPVSFRDGMCADIRDAIRGVCDKMTCPSSHEIATAIQESVCGFCNATHDDKFDEYLSKIRSEFGNATYVSFAKLRTQLEAYRQFVSKLDTFI